jgi:hypothetical protein
VQKLVRRGTALLTAAVLVAAGAGGAGCTQASPAARAPSAAPRIEMTGRPVVRGKLRAPAPLDDVLQDQGTPITLPDGRTMWIFADTADVFTAPGIFLTSSAAFTEPAAPNDLHFVLGPDGKPSELLPRTAAEQPTSKAEYDGVWPMGATRLPDGRILISYSKYHVTLATLDMRFVASGLFEYRYPGFPNLTAPVSAARIADDLWTAADGPVNSPVYANGFVYFVNCAGGGGCYSLRATPAGMTERSAYEWWTGSAWSRSKADRRPMTFGGPSVGAKAPGRSPAVAWVPQLGAYAMSDTVLGAATTNGLLWLASRPQGPWSEPIEYPLTNCGVRSCYLPNLQPQASTATSLRIAYSSGGRWGPVIWTMDVPVHASVAQRYTFYDRPVPVADTRTGEGMLVEGPLPRNGWRHVLMTQPDQPSNLATVTVAIDVSDATAPGHLHVSPSGSFRPGQVVEHTAGSTHAQLEVPVGPNNRIAITSDDGPVDVKVSLLGWSTAL